jgi:hypothetical protein
MYLKIILILLIICPALSGQQVVATSGGTFGNYNGTMSYTIGEGVAQTFTKGDKTLTQGFQQPKITVSEVYKGNDLEYSITVYPNPASDKVTIKIDKEDVAGLQYLLIDMNGKLIERQFILNNETSVSVNHLINGYYLLKVQAGVKDLKSFKIIKQ